MKDRSKLLAIGSIALALAGCQTLTSPQGYKFEQAGQASATTVPVRLVRADESPAPGAQVYSVQWVHYGPKTPVGRQLMPLQADAQGNFIYHGELSPGETLRLAAQLGLNGSLIYGSIKVH